MFTRRVGALRTARPYTYIGQIISLAAFALVGVACGPVEKGVKSPPPPPPPPPAPAEHVPPPAPAPEAKKPEDEKTKLVSNQSLGSALIATPESIYYSAELDAYLVSNINGAPLDKDDNGYILKLSADGTKAEKFIDGASDKITLNAPKGTAVSEGTLYVADIDTVRLFDAKTGEPKGEVAIKGATFLNDVAVNAKGEVYVSDSGLKPDFSSSGTDAVYKLKDGKAKKILASKKLGGPNGLLAGDDGVWVVTFGSGELSFVSDKGKQTQIQKLPKGKNDGIAKTKDGRILVSSWEGSSVLVGSPGGEFRELVTGIESPADIGYDGKRDRLLVPQFTKNILVLEKLDPPAPAPLAPAAPAAKEAKAESAPTAAKGPSPAPASAPQKEAKAGAAAAAPATPAKTEKAPAPPVAPAPSAKETTSPAAPANPATPTAPGKAAATPTAPTPPTPPTAPAK